MAERRIYYSEEAARLARRNRTVGLLAALGLGLTLGAALGLFVPSDKAHQLRDRMMSAASSNLKRGRKMSMKALKGVDLRGKAKDVARLLPIGH